MALHCLCLLDLWFFLGALGALAEKAIALPASSSFAPPVGCIDWNKLLGCCIEFASCSYKLSPTRSIRTQGCLVMTHLSSDFLSEWCHLIQHLCLRNSHFPAKLSGCHCHSTVVGEEEGQGMVQPQLLPHRFLQRLIQPSGLHCLLLPHLL